MPVRFLLTLAATLALVAGPAAAQTTEPPKAKAVPDDALADLLDKLHKHEVRDVDGSVLNDIPLEDILTKLSKQYNVTFVITKVMELAQPDIRTKRPNISATELRGLTLHQFLTLVLGNMGATYLVKGKMIEIMTPTYAAKVTGAALTGHESIVELAQPLVSAVIREKPFNEVAAQIAERYNLSVVISPQSGDGRMGFVSARLLNVLDLLAVQCDLRVVRKGNAFLVTSRDHANDLFNERLERERQLIELQKFREAPVPKPEPLPPPKQDKLPPEVAPIEVKRVDVLLPLQLPKPPTQPVPPPKPPQ
jgi:hypothetical protein